MHPDLMPFIVAQLASVLASITLLGWSEVEQYKKVYDDILQFVQVIHLKKRITLILKLYIGFSESSYCGNANFSSNGSRH